MPSLTEKVISTSDKLSKKKDEICQGTSEAAPGETVSQQLLNVMENKIRNLEKRKRKLEGYKKDLDDGKPLTDEQQLAVKYLHEVDGHLELCRDLIKQVNEVSVEAARMKKIEEKRSARERHQLELSNLRELIQVQSVLNFLVFDADVANDFLTGANSAVALTSAELKTLKEFRLLILPERSSLSWSKALEDAPVHAYNLIIASNKKVLNTTYKDLKCLIDKILHGGYFDKDRTVSSPPRELESDRSNSATDAPENANPNQRRKSSTGDHEWTPPNGSLATSVDVRPLDQGPNQPLGVDFIQPDQSGYRMQTSFGNVNDSSTNAPFVDENIPPKAAEEMATAPLSDVPDLSAPQPPPGAEDAIGQQQQHTTKVVHNAQNYHHHRPPRGRGGGGGRGYRARNGIGNGCYNCGGDHFARDCHEQREHHSETFSTSQERDSNAKGMGTGYRGNRGGFNTRGRGGGGYGRNAY